MKPQALGASFAPSVNSPIAGAGNGIRAPNGTLATPKASASGNAMNPTVTAARMSPASFSRL